MTNIEKPTVVFDFLGTDKRPKEMAEGARIALERMDKDNPYRVALVGPEMLIRSIQKEFGRDTVDCYPCNSYVTTADNSRTVLRAVNSSVAVSVKLVASGEADVVFICEDTRGATLWTARDPEKGGIGLIPGVLHPPLALTMPTFSGGRAILLDAGSGIDCEAPKLVQLAWLGRAFAQVALSIDEPRVALHSNGEEREKGNRVSKEALILLEDSKFPNFVGNLQPTDLVADKVDVYVCEGFVGNGVFKGIEAGFRLASQSLKSSISTKPELDLRQFGAMPLLGTNKLVMIGHGASDKYAVAYGIEASAHYARLDLANKIREKFVSH